jgi:hypothetical protein
VNLIGAFVGNKCEFRDGSIDSRAEVDLLEAKEMAESMGMAYFETSAVRGFPLFLSCRRRAPGIGKAWRRERSVVLSYSRPRTDLLLFLLSLLLVIAQANNINVDAPFQYIAEEFYRRYVITLPCTLPRAAPGSPIGA